MDGIGHFRAYNFNDKINFNFYEFIFFLASNTWSLEFRI